MKYFTTSAYLLMFTFMCECNAETHHGLAEELPGGPVSMSPDQPDIVNPAPQAHKSSEIVDRVDRKHSKNADVPDIDNFFDPVSHPVSKPKLTKPSFVVVWARTCGIYLLHKVMGMADWVKKLVARNEKKTCQHQSKSQKVMSLRSTGRL